jgi:hypothetical protein
MKGHPIQEPGIGIIADIDFDIDKKAASQEVSSKLYTPPRRRCERTKTGKGKPLMESQKGSTGRSREHTPVKRGLLDNCANNPPSVLLPAPVN